MWRREDETGNEAHKIMWELVPFTRGFGYDLGCGSTKAFPHFIGVDNGADERLFNMRCTPDLRLPTCEKLPQLASHSADFIFSSHLLEHIEDFESTLKDWWRVIKFGGYLCLYLPHRNFYPNIGTPGANKDHKHDFLPEDITKAMYQVSDGWDLVENQERNEGNEYSFFQVYKKLNQKVHQKSCEKPKPEKTCAVIRYGAYGDLIMASSIFPILKEQGYHITLYSVPRGFEAVKHDPHIDRVILQDPEQVPNQALGPYFDYIKPRYDKFVNLCESVEGTFLTMDGRPHLSFPHAVRHRLMNFNYVEIAHGIAEVPYKLGQRFYATKEEQDWAKRERQKMGGDFVVMWSLSGSSVHKHWPHMDIVLARLLLERKDVRIVLVGDQACQMLEAGWENESRILKRSGVWTIRESLSFLEQCDLVIGPETGVLNGAALLPMPKIITLSHSSNENLTRDWTNTTALEPQNTPCYPCHILHKGFEHCKEGFVNIEGVPQRVGSLCQVNITPDQMWEAIKPHISVADDNSEERGMQMSMEAAA